MLVSFFESIKYVGHIYPIALLRIYIGYYFLEQALTRMNESFLQQPRLAATIMEVLPQVELPAWYANFLQNIVVPNWQFFAYFIAYCEFVIGICLLIGFFVRPASLLGLILMINFVYIGGATQLAIHQTFLVLFVAMFWVGAGRCLGIDYYFYKRRRGLWW